MKRLCEEASYGIQVCKGLARLIASIQFYEMAGRADSQRASVIVVHGKETMRVTLRYCPYCGMRLSPSFVQGLLRSAGKVANDPRP